MFPYLGICLFFFFFWAFFYVLKLGPQKSGSGQLPPGPRPYPLIGNILELGARPHESLANLAKTYGPLMSLKLGTVTTIIVSSSSAAKEVLHKNDQSFAHRTVLDVIRALDHHKSSVVWSDADSKWRNLRKICSTEIFSIQKLDATRDLRQKKIQELLDHVDQCCHTGQPVQIGRAAFTTTLNLLSNSIFSSDLSSHTSESSQEFKDVVWGIMEVAGRPNLADFFPAVRSIDPQGLRRKMTHLFGKLIEIFDGIIKKRIELGDEVERKSDVLDTLIKLTKQEGSDFGYIDISHLFVDLFAAGTDTTSSTVEWAMAEVLRNPKILAKLKEELNNVIGKDGEVEESDIPKLPYLQAVIKETFRLHPAVPLLVPHRAVESNVRLSGFTIPKNTQVLFNAWAIGRDQNIWSDPTTFMPERFLEVGIDFKGVDFELIPMGAGRRICIGLPLAHRILHLTLASLLHSFDWKLEGDMKPEEMDMSEQYGFTLQKAQPLRAIPLKI